MAKGKSPGSGGLPMEFYVAFRDLIGEDLVDVFNASLKAGLLPFSQRVFLSVVGVCLPRSPLLAVLGLLGSELALLECFSFLSFVYGLLYSI